MTNKDAEPSSSRLDELFPDMQEKSKTFANKLPVLGHVMWLYMQSAPHKHYFVQDIESRVLSPIMLEQCKLYLKGQPAGLPMAFVSWAYLSEEAEIRYEQTGRIAPADWNSGENLWIVDMLAPFGGGEKIYLELYHSIFKDQEIHILFPSETGGMKQTTIQEILNGVAPGSN